MGKSRKPLPLVVSPCPEPPKPPEGKKRYRITFLAQKKRRRLKDTREFVECVIYHYLHPKTTTDDIREVVRGRCERLKWTMYEYTKFDVTAWSG